MRAEGFPRVLRVRRRADFLAIQGRGQKHHVRHFLVFVMREPVCVPKSTREVTGADGGHTLPPPRLGVTVTRKVGGAVVRNRIKRLVRESFRRERSRFQPGLSMVWIAKRDAVAVTLPQVLSEMQTLARRLSRSPQATRRDSLVEEVDA
jgi:ribonuclease P protein component